MSEPFPTYTERQFLAAMTRAARLYLNGGGYERFMDEVVNRCTEAQWVRAQLFLAAVGVLGERGEVS